MPIGLEQWRAQIGALEAQRYRYLSRAARKAARGGRSRVCRVSGRGMRCWVGFAVGVTLLGLVVSFSLLLLRAGDIEKNPGPLSDELLSTVDDTELTEEDISDVYEEVVSLAEEWTYIYFALRVLPPDTSTIAAIYHHPGDCLRETLLKWLRRSYNVKKYGPPSWKVLIKAVADPIVGDITALAGNIAKRHKLRKRKPGPTIVKPQASKQIFESFEGKEVKMEYLPPGFDYDPNLPMSYRYQLIAFENQQKRDQQKKFQEEYQQMLGKQERQERDELERQKLRAQRQQQGGSRKQIFESFEGKEVKMEYLPPGFDYDPNLPMSYRYQLIAFENQQKRDQQKKFQEEYQQMLGKQERQERDELERQKLRAQRQQQGGSRRQRSAEMLNPPQGNPSNSLLLSPQHHQPHRSPPTPPQSKHGKPPSSHSNSSIISGPEMMTNGARIMHFNLPTVKNEPQFSPKSGGSSSKPPQVIPPKQPHPRKNSSSIKKPEPIHVNEVGEHPLWSGHLSMAQIAGGPFHPHQFIPHSLTYSHPHSRASTTITSAAPGHPTMAVSVPAHSVAIAPSGGEASKRSLQTSTIVKPHSAMATFGYGPPGIDPTALSQTKEDGHDSSGSGSLLSTHRKKKSGLKQPETPALAPIPFNAFNVKIQPISPGNEVLLQQQQQQQLQKDRVFPSMSVVPTTRKAPQVMKSPAKKSNSKVGSPPSKPPTVGDVMVQVSGELSVHYHQPVLLGTVPPTHKKESKPTASTFAVTDSKGSENQKYTTSAMPVTPVGFGIPPAGYQPKSISFVYTHPSQHPRPHPQAIAAIQAPSEGNKREMKNTLPNASISGKETNDRLRSRKRKPGPQIQMEACKRSPPLEEVAKRKGIPPLPVSQRGEPRRQRSTEMLNSPQGISSNSLLLILQHHHPDRSPPTPPQSKHGRPPSSHSNCSIISGPEMMTNGARIMHFNLPTVKNEPQFSPKSGGSSSKQPQPPQVIPPKQPHPRKNSSSIKKPEPIHVNEVGEHPLWPGHLPMAQIAGRPFHPHQFIPYSLTHFHPHSQASTTITSAAPGHPTMAVSVPAHSVAIAPSGGEASKRSLQTSKQNVLPPGFDDPNLPMSFRYQLIAFENQQKQAQLKKFQEEYQQMLNKQERQERKELERQNLLSPQQYEPHSVAELLPPHHSAHVGRTSPSPGKRPPSRGQEWHKHYSPLVNPSASYDRQLSSIIQVSSSSSNKRDMQKQYHFQGHSTSESKPQIQQSHIHSHPGPSSSGHHHPSHSSKPHKSEQPSSSQSQQPIAAVQQPIPNPALAQLRPSLIRIPDAVMAEQWMKQMQMMQAQTAAMGAAAPHEMVMAWQQQMLAAQAQTQVQAQDQAQAQAAPLQLDPSMAAAAALAFQQQQ